MNLWIWVCVCLSPTSRWIFFWSLGMMAQLMAEWKGLRDQPEILEQGRRFQKVLAESDGETAQLVSAREGERWATCGWRPIHMVERSGQPEILISCSGEWVAGSVPQKAWFRGGICILVGGWQKKSTHPIQNKRDTARVAEKGLNLQPCSQLLEPGERLVEAQQQGWLDAILWRNHPRALYIPQTTEALSISGIPSCTNYQIIESDMWFQDVKDVVLSSRTL